MGLFKINYEKEGPGVSKKEPKKKSFVRFFELYYRNFWKLMSTTFYYILICMPIVTYGLADVGFAHVTRSLSREKHSFGKQDFFDTIKKNWKQALVVGIVNLLLTAAMAYSLVVYYLSPGTMSAIVTGVTLFCLITFSIMKYYMPLLIVSFSLNMKQLYKNTFKFVFLNLPRNLMMFFVLLAFDLLIVFLLLASPFTGMVGSLLLFLVYPGFRSFLIQFTIFDCIRKYMIDPYYEEHPDADIQKRLDLGLDVPEEYLPKFEDDDVFNDERMLPASEEE
ncbi:MAG: DUF624 domain-containing protein [Ruminococcaceae bacterium]|nr:DUF624 domain-containing protein [Oscillospiraceae bacterium]